MKYKILSLFSLIIIGITSELQGSHNHQVQKSGFYNPYEELLTATEKKTIISEIQPKKKSNALIPDSIKNEIQQDVKNEGEWLIAGNKKKQKHKEIAEEQQLSTEVTEDDTLPPVIREPILMLPLPRQRIAETNYFSVELPMQTSSITGNWRGRGHGSAIYHPYCGRGRGSRSYSYNRYYRCGRGRRGQQSYSYQRSFPIESQTETLPITRNWRGRGHGSSAYHQYRGRGRGSRFYSYQIPYYRYKNSMRSNEWEEAFRTLNYYQQEEDIHKYQEKGIKEIRVIDSQRRKYELIWRPDTVSTSVDNQTSEIATDESKNPPVFREIPAIRPYLFEDSEESIYSSDSAATPENVSKTADSEKTAELE